MPTINNNFDSCLISLGEVDHFKSVNRTTFWSVKYPIYVLFAVLTKNRLSCLVVYVSSLSIICQENFSKKLSILSYVSVTIKITFIVIVNITHIDHLISWFTE